MACTSDAFSPSSIAICRFERFNPEVQPHEIEAQHPHAQRLVMPGQHGAGEVVEARAARLAPIPLATRLGVVTSVPDHGLAVAAGAAHAPRPAPLAHEGEALGVVQQAGEVDQLGCGHKGGGSSCEPVSYSYSCLEARPLSAPRHGSHLTASEADKGLWLIKRSTNGLSPINNLLTL